VTVGAVPADVSKVTSALSGDARGIGGRHGHHWSGNGGSPAAAAAARDDGDPHECHKHSYR
jgi:hypothetical protein